MKKPLQESIQQTVQKAWSDAVSAVMGLEGEMAKRLQKVKELTDLHAGSEEVQRLLADVRQRMQQNSEVLEQRIHESVGTVISKVRTPLMDELATLKGRAEQIGTRIERQLHLRKKDQGRTDESDESESESADKDSADAAQ
jgi:acetyl-CoA carboxylase carboxyltransferase component